MNNAEQLLDSIENTLMYLQSDSQINGLETVRRDILKSVILPLLQEIDNTVSLKEKEKMVMNLITEINNI